LIEQSAPRCTSQTGHVPGARRAEQAGIARISNASNLGSLFRYHTRLAALDWIMSAFGFAFSALIASRRTRLVRGAPHSSDVRGPYDIAL
jgi:hypothetical protein